MPKARVGAAPRAQANYVFSAYFAAKLGSCNFNGAAVMSDATKGTPPCVYTGSPP